jgi:hypothetical protein
MSSSSRLHEINERLKVICPDNDDGQYDRREIEMRKELHQKMFGCGWKKTWIKFSSRTAELSQRRLRLIMDMVEKLELNSSADVFKLRDKTGVDIADELQKEYSRKLDNAIRQFRYHLCEIETERDGVIREYAAGRNLLAEEMYVKMGRPSPAEQAVKKYGAAEHRVEVAALKDERRRLLSQ